MISSTSHFARAYAIARRCVAAAPLHFPVVPLVYAIQISSSSRVSSSSAAIASAPAFITSHTRTATPLSPNTAFTESSSPSFAHRHVVAFASRATSRILLAGVPESTFTKLFRARAHACSATNASTPSRQKLRTRRRQSARKTRARASTTPCNSSQVKKHFRSFSRSSGTRTHAMALGRSRALRRSAASSVEGVIPWRVPSIRCVGRGGVCGASTRYNCGAL